MASYVVHAAEKRDIKGLSALDSWKQPHKIVYAGSDDLEKAKALAVEAVAKKYCGPTTVAYVTDMDPTSEKFEERIHEESMAKGEPVK